MNFPAHLFTHANGDDTDAARWLRALLGAGMPDPIRFFLVDEAKRPSFLLPKYTRSYGMFAVALEQPDMRVFVWRDHSAIIDVLVDGAWQTLPATFAVPSAFYMRNTTITEAQIIPHDKYLEVTLPLGQRKPFEEAFWMQVRARAAEVMEAKPVLDPRHHRFERKGRFANFVPWPTTTAEDVQPIRAILDAFALIRAHQGVRLAYITLYKAPYPSLWKRTPADPKFLVTAMQRDGRDKPSQAWCRKFLAHKTCPLPRAHLYSANKQRLVHHEPTLPQTVTHHALAQAYSVLNTHCPAMIPLLPGQDKK